MRTCLERIQRNWACLESQGSGNNPSNPGFSLVLNREAFFALVTLVRLSSVSITHIHMAGLEGHAAFYAVAKTMPVVTAEKAPMPEQNHYWRASSTTPLRNRALVYTWPSRT